ncbi:MAG: hypothetical protein ACRC6V_06930 [Bacteroidales bacterium]
MDAEVKVIEYLSQMYDIEEELVKGKSIPVYDRRIAYLEGSFMLVDGESYRAIKDISGLVKPHSEPYWVELADEPLEGTYTLYNQYANYNVGDIVVRKDMYYECSISHGYDFDNIRIPTLKTDPLWKLADYYDFIQYEDRMVGDYVKYQDGFYRLETLVGYDSGIVPSRLACFEPIAEYDENVAVKIGDKIGFENELYECLGKVNPDTPELKVNIAKHDPRNYSLIKHMVEISLYYGFMEFAANNIPQARINAYEAAENWLKDASKLRIDPKIERRKTPSGSKETLHAMSSFVNESQYKDNVWGI